MHFQERVLMWRCFFLRLGFIVSDMSFLFACVHVDGKLTIV